MISIVEYLVSLVPDVKKAWDCGTGNGQMAILLASYFDRVYATDISASQLNHAPEHKNIDYSLQPAERTSFENHFFDLITVCQAVHWFDFELFYREVQRVAKKRAILALIGYHIPSVTPQIDECLNELYTYTLSNYWDKERRYVDEEYTTIPFPFEEIISPKFSIACLWTVEQYIKYLNTWSSIRHYVKKEGKNPLNEFLCDINPLWKGVKKVTFPIFTRIGRIV